MKTQWPKHIGMTRRQFMRAKKKVLKFALLTFDCRERDADCADDIITGAGYLPDDVHRDIHEAYRLLRSVLKKLNQTKC